MANKFISAAILTPLSKLYGVGVYMRNLLFQWGILHQHKFDIPVVVIGNIAVGGTGKTPLTVFMFYTLGVLYRIGSISRGYKRKTKGFVLATKRSTPHDIGDEPYQMFQKFGQYVRIAVCEDRCAGIEELRKIDPAINLIVLDDAFQHRYVKPTVSIVLTEFNRPFFMDKMLPLGRLREQASGVERADMVVVTKCPEQIKPLEYRLLHKGVNPRPCQKLYCSRIIYNELTPLFPDLATYVPSLRSINENDAILAVAGIAHPRGFLNHLSQSGANVRAAIYPDHHDFSRRDIDNIARKYTEMQGENKYIITTEKDAMRLLCNPYFPYPLKPYVFYQPISVEMDDKESLNFTDDVIKLIEDSKAENQ